MADAGGLVAVVLAAGAGRRFGGPGQHKLLAADRGVPVVRRAVDAAAGSGIGPVLVVTGAVDLTGVLPDGVVEVRAPGWAGGQAHSLAAGVDAAAAMGAAAVVVGLGDMPEVPPEAWRAVAGRPGRLVVGTRAGRRAPPVKVDRSLFARLPRDGDEGARRLMAEHPDLVVEVEVPGTDRDVDHPADLLP